MLLDIFKVLFGVVVFFGVITFSIVSIFESVNKKEYDYTDEDIL